MSSTNANPPADVTTVLVLGIPYVVATNQYIVSGSPVKDPRLMYWTERSFVDTGKPVLVPSARVGAVTVVYNNAFPERVPTEVVIPGASPVTTSNTLPELRTLWLDETGGQSGGQIRAYNVEGRIFTELLGDVRDFLRDRKGAVIGRKLAQTYGFRVGDVVPLRGTIFPGNWEFVVRAIYDGATPRTDTSQFFFHWDYLNESIRARAPQRADQVGVFVVRVADAGRALCR